MRPGKILVIDRQDEWRTLFVEMLETAGFLVSTLDHYDYPPSADVPSNEKPDLIILGCGVIGPVEFQLIERVFAAKLHLIVLSTAVPWQDMRRLFLAGADDVTDKPYTQTHLVNIVEEVLQNIRSKDSYQLVKQGGKV